MRFITFKPYVGHLILVLWRHSSVCVNKVRQLHANIRIVHVLIRILNECNKIPQDLRSSHIRLNITSAFLSA